MAFITHIQYERIYNTEEGRERGKESQN